MDHNEIIETKTNYWYYFQIGVLSLIIIAIPFVLFQDYIINLFTK